MRTKRLSGAVREVSGLTPRGPATISFARRIKSITSDSASSKHYLIPGLIDLQINGAYGIDVMSASAAELLRLSERLARDGTTSWLPTVITSPLETIERCDRIIGEAMEMQREMERASADRAKAPPMSSILGMHLEGPFISSKRLGAHPPLNLLPTRENLARVLRLKTLKLITLAPELSGAREAIGEFIRRGVAVALGHSDATYAEAIAGIDAGARMFTHVFNAMRPLHHREPGIVGAALTHPRAFAAIIADGVHIHLGLIRLLQNTGSRPILVSDRVAPAGLDSGDCAVFGGLLKNAALVNGAVRTPDGRLAGACATMLEGARNFWGHKAMDDQLSALADATAARPATILNLRDRGAIAAGKRADLLLLDRGLKLKTVFIGGREVQ